MLQLDQKVTFRGHLYTIRSIQPAQPGTKLAEILGPIKIISFHEEQLTKELATELTVEGAD